MGKNFQIGTTTLEAFYTNIKITKKNQKDKIMNETTNPNFDNRRETKIISKSRGKKFKLHLELFFDLSNLYSRFQVAISYQMCLSNKRLTSKNFTFFQISYFIFSQLYGCD